MNDLISRQDAIDEISRWIGYLDDDMILRIQIGLRKLPSVQSEPHEGEWIVHLYRVGVSRYECDACNARCDITYPYCPHCGEKKRGERNATN